MRDVKIVKIFHIVLECRFLCWQFNKWGRRTSRKGDCLAWRSSSNAWLRFWDIILIDRPSAIRWGMRRAMCWVPVDGSVKRKTLHNGDRWHWFRRVKVKDLAPFKIQDWDTSWMGEDDSNPRTKWLKRVAFDRQSVWTRRHSPSISWYRQSSTGCTLSSSQALRMSSTVILISPFTLNTLSITFVDPSTCISKYTCSLGPRSFPNLPFTKFP